VPSAFVDKVEGKVRVLYDYQPAPSEVEADSRLALAKDNVVFVTRKVNNGGFWRSASHASSDGGLTRRGRLVGGFVGARRRIGAACASASRTLPRKLRSAVRRRFRSRSAARIDAQARAQRHASA
jgi:hypothetical protein